MCSSRSPGVDTATRAPSPNTRNGCRDAGRGWPNSASQALEPNAQTQDRFCWGARVPTVRVKVATSAHQPRTVSAAAAPGFSVATMNIA
ncbi:hypothetical protein D3C71_1859980 [compost metagenome]